MVLASAGLNDVYSLANDDLTAVQVAVTRKIVDELSGFGNLYYEVCNEPYFGGVTMPWQHLIVDTIVQAGINLCAATFDLTEHRQRTPENRPATPERFDI